MFFNCLILPTSANELEIPEQETEIDEYDATPQLYVLSVPQEYQGLQTNLCGVFSTHMVCLYKNPNNCPTIEQLKTAVSYNPGSGTSSYYIANYLHNSISSGYARHLYSTQNRGYRLRNSIQVNYPLIVSVHIMPYRVYGSSNSGHFIVVKGFYYDPVTEEFNVYINDPYDGDEYTTSFAGLDYGCSSLSGYYIWKQ